MASFRDFLSSILPGNYALTKSMEMTKINTSGTLWYMKKFLVLYYYVFLSDKIYTSEYIDEVIGRFDNYIGTLDESVKPSAEKFFYPQDGAVNFKSDSFKTFSSFVLHGDFNTDAEKKEYLSKAKKYYFAILMGSGGQRGVKKLVKEAVKASDFVYTFASMKNIIDEAVAVTVSEEVNTFRCIKDNTVKYLASEQAVETITELSDFEKVSVERVKSILRKYPHESPKYLDVESDIIGFIRNERQAMYYYGYFHSRSYGEKDMEFSSLTPVGAAALAANSSEFSAIWEHQKIKMISQPVTADIKNVTYAVNPVQSFAISYTPYTDILGYVLRNNSMSVEEYRFIVARRKHTIGENDWQKIEPDVKNGLGDIKKLICSFDRKMDAENHDGRKELLKYLLGLRSDLKFDKGKNLHNILELNASGALCVNPDGLNFIYAVYSALNDYKLRTYGELFERSEQELKRRYIAACEGKHTVIDAKVKIDWDLYNIHIDKFILIGALICIAASKYNIKKLAELKSQNINLITEFCCSDFSSVLKSVGLKSKTSVRRDISRFIVAVKEKDYSYFTDTEYGRVQAVARYRDTETSVLLAKIKAISARTSVEPEDGRRRNRKLHDLMKSYYMQRYGENGTLKCECCAAEAFLNVKFQPYVEFHHLIPFKEAYGPDHFLNLFALCPECHKKLHFINLDERESYYKKLNCNNYMHESFVKRLIALKKKNLLRSYHLEYLLADRAITETEHKKIAVWRKTV